MTHEGNGQQVHFQLDMSGQVHQQLELLVLEAMKKGVAPAVKRALEIITRRLHEAPWDFGEMIEQHKHLKLVDHVGFVAPVRVWFAIHQELPFVILQRVKLVIPE